MLLTRCGVIYKYNSTELSKRIRGTLYDRIMFERTPRGALKEKKFAQNVC